jgi:hypothetical protein
MPAGAFRAAIEPLPERITDDAIVKEYGFGVVGFVGNLSEVASAFRKPETTSVKMQLPFLHKPLYLAINCLLEVRPRSVETKEARGLYHYIVS